MKNEILAEKDPSEFSNRPVAIKVENEIAYVHPLLPPNDFKEMQSRRIPVDPEEMRHNLHKGNGHTFANLGVSAELMIRLYGSDYLILVSQERKDFGDHIAKLVSGYVPEREIFTPEKAMLREIAEEVLPFDIDGRVMRFSCKGRDLARPYSEHFTDHPETIELKANPEPFLKDIPKGVKIYHTGPQMDAGIIYHAPTNSANLIFSYIISMTDMNFGWFNSLEHAEDKHNPETGRLETRIVPNGLYLSLLDLDRKMGRSLTTMDNGLIHTPEGKIVLSEAFAPKKDGIVKVNNIQFQDYIRNQDV